MKKYITILFVILSSVVNAQSVGKKVIITQVPKTVPAGKIWKLERGKETIVQLNEGTLKNGTLCNALFLSRPGIVFSLNKGDYQNGEGYGILFKNFEKVQYTNDITYSITPISFVDKEFDLESLSTNAPEDVGTNELSFKAGEKVFVSTCFVTIELAEYNMSHADLEIERKKLAAIENEKKRLKANFKIPINPEKYVEPGTKPAFHDNLLSIIIFTSDGVLHKRPGKGFALDDESVWTMDLTTEEFNINSSNGIQKSYKVLDIEYDNTLNMQAFKLGNHEGKHTHNLNISWSNSSKQYSLLLSSIDQSEEYQFQNTQATKKQ